jgi:transcriptional antiterminator NusG
MIKVGDEAMVAEHRWYAIHTYSGFENKVKTTIERLVETESHDEDVRRVLIPQEPIIEIKKGKKHTVMRNLMPGYLLIEMMPLEELFNKIREIKGVSGFVGGGGKPAPLSQAEVDNILGLMASKADKPKPEITYDKGDQVKVTEGPFANFVGTVDHVDKEKHKLSVMVSIFGRPTPVELDVLQVEPI